MAPLKPYFRDYKHHQVRELLLVKKCIRTGDIENVGKLLDMVLFLRCLEISLLEITLKRNNSMGLGICNRSFGNTKG